MPESGLRNEPAQRNGTPNITKPVQTVHNSQLVIASLKLAWLSSNDRPLSLPVIIREARDTTETLPIQHGARQKLETSLKRQLHLGNSIPIRQMRYCKYALTANCLPHLRDSKLRLT